MLLSYHAALMADLGCVGSDKSILELLLSLASILVPV
jgi:hypothetical protein